MKLVVATNNGKIVATFADAENMDYVDYSAELDEAVASAVRVEGKRLPAWLRRNPSRV